ncbi:MAG: hypothetical protein ACO397_05950 [Gammaproteobacteria bacterium]
MSSKFSFTQSLRGVDFYGSEAVNPAFISSSSNFTASGAVIKYSSVAINIESSANQTGTSIVLGQSLMTGTAFTVSAMITIEISDVLLISSSGSLKVVGIVKFSPLLIEDTQSIRPFITIDDVPISEHGRTFNESFIYAFIETKNWDSKINRYYKRSNARRSFSLSWKFLPGEREATADLRFGRNKVKEISQDPDIHTLKIKNIDTDGLTPYSEDEYTVLVKSYSEKLLRRDEINNVYYWDCSLELEEV